MHMKNGMIWIRPFRRHSFMLDLPPARQTKIDCVDLSEFISSLNRRIRLLKVDIEGG